MTTKIMRSGAPLLALLLLGGMIGERTLTQRVEGNPAAYQATVRRAMARIPYQFGDWVGVDVPVPAAAVALLKPNVILSRRYTNLRTEQSVSLLFVHCSDARDLLGHYPPVCYPGQGWVSQRAAPHDWNAGTRQIHGMVYEFTRLTEAQQQGLRIANFMATPDGLIRRDMDSLQRFAKDRYKKAFGAGQCQVIVNTDMDEKDANRIFIEFFKAIDPLMHAVLREKQ